MNPKFYLASFIACFLALNGFAQKQNVYFLKNNGKYVTERDSADYTRIVREPDSGTVLYNVIEYYLNGNPKMIGKSSTIDPIKLEGQFVSFYPDKNKKRIGTYENGQLTGEIYDYYPNGKLYRQSTCLKFTDKKSFMPEDEKQTVQAAYDSTGAILVKDGDGHYPIFDGNFKTIKEEGDVKDGKKNGTWKGTLNQGKVTFTEEYADGKFMKGTRTEENGTTINYTVKEALPTFKGGESAFGRYLSQNVHYPARPKQRNIQGRVILSFTVEKDGSLTDFKILKSVDPDLDAEAIRVLSQSPKWNPGIQQGAAVKVAYTMPFNFSLGGR
ncbi:energy transducer TonB [Mucilaginibacter arboris]|uniref:TonB family protein n=1 Tax=Mucilaginibacter arboris TaxID=2682090 RepID=A0A7K1SVG3_9SPHI|nr:energy transducer TonB [Mucilaginibacter arboris]MVN21228.1 TonB family protein [Mucilaginibacter arboris]